MVGWTRPLVIGMVVLSAGREPVRSAADLLERARKAKATAPGQPLLLRVLANGAARWVAVPTD